MRSTDRIAGALSGRAKAVTYAGAAAALLGAGTASAVTIAGVAHSTPAKASSTVQTAAKSSSTVRAGVRHAPSARKAEAGVVQAHQAAAHVVAKPKAVANPHTWAHAEVVAASQTKSEPKAADQLQPVGTAGAQSYMQLSQSQLDNAKTIVQQSLAKNMGVRSAVIAVATSMQESMLMNINYGDRDSLGLFFLPLAD